MVDERGGASKAGSHHHRYYSLAHSLTRSLWSGKRVLFVTSGAVDCCRQNTGLATGWELVAHHHLVARNKHAARHLASSSLYPDGKKTHSISSARFPPRGCGGAQHLLHAQAAFSYSSQSSEVVEGQGEKEVHEGGSWSPLLVF